MLFVETLGRLLLKVGLGKGGESGSKKPPQPPEPWPSANRPSKAPAPEKYKFSLVIIGDSNIGKTRLLLRYIENNFEEGYIRGIDGDFRKKELEIDGRRVELTIWDVPGVERSSVTQAVTAHVKKGASGHGGAILVAFDVTDRASFDNAKQWKSECEYYVSEGTYFIVGLKSDLANQRVVSTQEAKVYAYGQGAQYFETSAKSGNGVDELFTGAARKCLAYIAGEYEEPTFPTAQAQQP